MMTIHNEGMNSWQKGKGGLLRARQGDEIRSNQARDCLLLISFVGCGGRLAPVYIRRSTSRTTVNQHAPPSRTTNFY